MELADDVILLTNRQKRLEKRIMRGIIGSSEAEVEKNKVRKSLLDLVKEAKALE